jgi:hypothetical protein
MEGNNLHNEFMFVINESQGDQTDSLDFQWVRDDCHLGGNVLNIGGEVIPSLANCDTTPMRRSLLENRYKRDEKNSLQ